MAVVSAADRWWTPDAGSAGEIRFGGFVGLGGPFEQPPQVRGSTDGFLVRSGARLGLLVADAWGATLHPATEDEFDRAAPPTAASGITSRLVADGLLAATTGDSVALASPYSHHIEVRPWRP